MPSTAKRDIFLAVISGLLPSDEKDYLLTEGNNYIVAVIKLEPGSAMAYYYGDEDKCRLAAKNEKATGDYPWLSNVDIDELPWTYVQLKKTCKDEVV